MIRRRPLVLVIGAGFAGSVAAEQLASAGAEVVVCEQRAHIGGNAYDELDDHGILVHRYGPHIFHTNSARVFNYLSRFTDWRPYEHRVRAFVKGKLLPIPINRTTINELYGWKLSEAEVCEYLNSVRITRLEIRTSEDVVLSRVGRELTELFFRGYTRKQWGKDLSELAPNVAGRIPVRTNDDDRYFTDRYQVMPKDGYTAMFRRMLEHPRIHVLLNTDGLREKNHMSPDLIIYTGPIDRYFDYQWGHLPYRSLQFRHVHIQDVRWFQPFPTVNYPNDFDYTRITEFKYLTGQDSMGTSIVFEYPTAEGDPYYPVPASENWDLYQRYSHLASGERNVIFVGRLAQYKYLNMDQTVAAALEAARRAMALLDLSVPLSAGG